MNVVIEVNDEDVDTFDYFELTLPQLVATVQHHAQQTKRPIRDVTIHFDDEYNPSEEEMLILFEINGRRVGWMEYASVSLYEVLHKANRLAAEQRRWLSVVTLRFVPEDEMETTSEGDPT